MLNQVKPRGGKSTERDSSPGLGAARRASAKEQRSRRSSRVENAALTRDRILSIASRMFADRGFDAVTTRQIASAANVTFPMMYRHFNDKRTLYLAACGSALGRVAEKYLAIVQANGAADARLLSFVAELYKDLLTDPCVYKLVQREILDRDDVGIEKLTKAYFMGQYLAVRQICENLVGKSAGDLGAFNIYMAVFGFVQFRPIGLVVTAGRSKWKDTYSVARMILTLVLPQIDWSKVKDTRGSKNSRK
jgi:AcrR family transcriptional regulator